MLARTARCFGLTHGCKPRLFARYLANVPTFWDPLGQDFVEAVKRLVQTKTKSGQIKRVVPLPIQRASLKHLLGGKDACLLSSTGSGKTLAYAIPLAYRLACNEDGAVVRVFDIACTIK